MQPSSRIFLWVAIGLVPSLVTFAPSPVSAQVCNGGRGYCTTNDVCTGSTSADSACTSATSPICCTDPTASPTGGCTGVCRRIDDGCGTDGSAPGTCGSALQICCNTPGGGGTTTTTTGGTTSVSFANPLRFTTVNELLTSLLTFLQTFIVMLALIFIIIGALLYVTSAGNDSRMETAKKCIMGAMVGLALGIAAPAFLREISNILGWNAGSASLPAGVGTSLSLLEIAANVLNFLLTVIGILAIIMLVIGGSMYLLAAGDEDRIDRGKKIVKYSIIGILVALGSMVLVRQIAAFFTP